VVYPQLLEGEAIPLPLAGSGCAGQRVNVSLVVGEEGTVKRCKVLSVVPAACAEAARTHAMRYRFKPALDAEGRPVETTVAAAVDFLEAP
jgi:outer membrane biosynthesis protein TonB